MEIKYSVPGAFKLFTLTVLCAAVCYGYVGIYAKYYDYSPGLYGGAWVALFVYLGLSILILLFSLRRGVAISLTDQGILNHRGRWPLIRWEQLDSVRISPMGFTHMLILQPGEGFPPSIKLDPDGTTSFGFVGLRPGCSEVFAWLRANHPELFSR